MSDPSNDETRLSTDPGAPGRPRSDSDWLTASGSIDHGHFTPGDLLDGRYRIAGLIGRAVLCVYVGSWIFSATHIRNADLEVQRFFEAVGRGLFAGGTVWLFYLAAEPRVRRIWPHMLITWSRLISGVIRDPLIGRDLIVGTLAGVTMTAVSYVFFLVPEWLNWLAFTPHLTKIDTAPFSLS